MPRSPLLHSPHPCACASTCHVPRRALSRSQILRATSANSPLPPTYYKAISQHLSKGFADSTYLKDGPPKGDAQQSAPPNPLTDPAAMDGMMGQMKTQMVMMVPQMVIMGWINFFFQGFVLSESQLLPTLLAPFFRGFTACSPTFNCSGIPIEARF